MKFPNAATGVRKIFTAQVLSLISSIAMIIALILLIVTGAAANANSDGGVLAAGMGTLVLMLASFILILIAAIMSLVGIIQAAKDEGAFKTALYAIIISLVAAVVAAIFSSNGTVQGICQVVQNIMSIAVTVFVITGIINLADQLNNAEVSQKGTNLMKVIVCVYVLALIASVVSLIFGGTFASVTAAIIALVATILNVIAYFLYLSLLSKGKKMLAE